MADDDYCYVSTRGRVTGRTHRIEIWYARDGDTLYLLSGGGRRSDWVKNLMADAAVEVEVEGQRRAATARVLAEPGEEQRRARNMVYEKYRTRYRGSLEQWRDTALPVALDLA